jgi:dethiobiotin synthetase
MYRRIAIAGIHTGIGKTIASAVLAEVLGADYWKPVQAGSPDSTDTMLVKSFLRDGAKRVHPEAVMLTEPMSPHAAAKAEGVQIDHAKFSWPITDKTLLIETAGGILSPMSDHATMADFMQHFSLPVLLISNNYLGSINHTLLSIEVLKKRGLNILGLVMNGTSNPSSEEFIETYSSVPVIARIPFFAELNSKSIQECVAALRGSLLEKLDYERN